MKRGGFPFNRRGALRAGFVVALLGATSVATANDSVVGAGSLGTAVTTTPDDTEVVSPDALTGEARTSIPIVAPPARGSVQLGLALDYDSATGMREAGMG